MALIAGGAVYAVLYSAPVAKKPAVREQPSRSLAYEQQINRADGPAPAAESGAETQAMAPAAAPANTQNAPAPQAEAATPENEDAAQAPDAEMPAEEEDSETANLPPDEAAGPPDPNALPWQQARPGTPDAQGEGPPGDADAGNQMPPPGAEGYEPDGDYPQDDVAARPGENDDPNAWPSEQQQQQQDGQEWVQVLVSGAGMHGAASDESPALFVFPYGRALKVVSRYGNWVQVTDPQSATTGWMEAQYLAPMAAPRAPGQNDAMYDDRYDDGGYDQDEPFRRRGWFRRHGGGFADMINRALGGH
jgi:hypothetical protein